MSKDEMGLNNGLGLWFQLKPHAHTFNSCLFIPKLIVELSQR